MEWGEFYHYCDPSIPKVSVEEIAQCASDAYHKKAMVSGYSFVSLRSEILFFFYSLFACQEDKGNGAVRRRAKKNICDRNDEGNCNSRGGLKISGTKNKDP